MTQSSTTPTSKLSPVSPTDDWEIEVDLDRASELVRLAKSAGSGIDLTSAESSPRRLDSQLETSSQTHRSGIPDVANVAAHELLIESEQLNKPPMNGWAALAWSAGSMAAGFATAGLCLYRPENTVVISAAGVFIVAAVATIVSGEIANR